MTRSYRFYIIDMISSMITDIAFQWLLRWLPIRQITSQMNFPGRVADLVCPGVPLHLALLLAPRLLLPAQTPMGDVLCPPFQSSLSSSSSSPISRPSLPPGGCSRSLHHLRPHTPRPQLVCCVDLVSWKQLTPVAIKNCVTEWIGDPNSTCLFLIDSFL